MLYRRFGKLNWHVSALGFGAMRLPITGGNPANINQHETTRMIRYAIDHGVNYIDTAYGYHQGKSETAVGKALKDGYREKVKLATKLPPWNVQTQKDMDQILKEQLKRLQVNHIDFYLLHALDSETWTKMKNLNIQNWLHKKVQEGKINHTGFSFHDEYSTFKQIIDDNPDWTFCQIQYNYVDNDYQAGTRGLKYAAQKGLAIIVMEPIAGGKLAINPPKTIQDQWNKMPTKRTPAEWALRWVWNHPEVSTTLSGMSTMEQVIENVETADRSHPGSLTKKELNIINHVREQYKKAGYVSCSGCRYCMPCPQGVNIPEILALHNEYYAKNRDEQVKSKYQAQIPPGNRADACIHCGRCEELCPQKLPIQELLGETRFILEQ